MSKTQIYGEHNGSEYRSVERDRLDGSGKSDGVEFKTHWDPRLEIQAIAGTVQMGIVPPKTEANGDFADPAVWDNDDGQFISLSRDGCNRAIKALKQYRNKVYGKDA